MNIVEFKEKHGSRYFVYETQGELHVICQKVMKDRIKDGYWYEDNDEHADLMNQGLTDPHMAYQFMMVHGDYEYEYVYFHKTETV